MPGYRLLRYPWSLHAPEETSALYAERGVEIVSPACGSLLFADDGRPPIVDGDPDGAEVRGRFETRQRERQALYTLPVPLRPNAIQEVRHPEWRGPARLSRTSTVPRPRLSGAGEGDEEPGGPWFRFLLTLVGRMRDFETALEASHLPWDAVLARWLEEDEAQDPTMDILVKHARDHRARWADIVERPRRILNRRREMLPLGRVEELDTHCMEWLGRQPGQTVAERAGGRQRILALARYENQDTLENRVFRDMLERSAAAARDYLRINAGRRHAGLPGRTSRYALVERYARECRRLARELAAIGVRRETGTITPNYVLQHDDRYRYVWEARDQLIKRERVFDELWHWQHRAWEEFCRAACTVALLSGQDRELIAASPLYFRPEHRRGAWLLHDDPLTVIADHARERVIEVLQGDSRALAPGLSELGASAWLRIADMGGGDRRYLAVWALHGPAAADNLGRLLKSAAAAISRMPSQARLDGGIILQALVDPAARIAAERSGRVLGIAFGPGGTQLGSGLRLLAADLAERIGEVR